MKKICFFLMTAALVLTSCRKDKSVDEKVDYMPFQETEGGNWGMIGTDGEVLFSEEFTSMPTLSVNGRFMVKNSEGLWEIYTAEKKPKKIGGEYLKASLFFEDVAPVVAKDQPIQLIDRDGNVKVTLDKIGGKTVSECSFFVGGRLVVKVGGLWGAVDTDGDVVVEPKYAKLQLSSSGYFFAMDKKYAEETNQEKIVYTVLDRNGKEVGTIKGSKFKEVCIPFDSFYTSGAIFTDAVALTTEMDGKDATGLMGFDGEWKLKPLPKVKHFAQKYGDYLVFASGDDYGLMDLTGEELIRPKFKSLHIITENVLAGAKSGETTWTLYDREGEKISQDSYIYAFSFGADHNIFVKLGKHDWTMLNKDGDDQKLKADIFEIGYAYPDHIIESDYLDFDDVVSEMRITKEGVFGLSTWLIGPEVVNYINNNLKPTPSLSTNPSNYNGSSDITRSMVTGLQAGKAPLNVEVNTFGLTKKETTGSGWFRYTRDVWSDEYVKGYQYTFLRSSISQFEGRMHELYSKLYEAVKHIGKVVKEGKNAAVVDVGQGLVYYVSWGGQRVDLYYGFYEVETCDVKAFDSVTEDNFLDVERPRLTLESNGSVSPYAADADDDDYGELESPPAEDL